MEEHKTSELLEKGIEQTDTESDFAFDDVWEYIGGFGRFQRIFVFTFITIFCGSIPALCAMEMVFLDANNGYHCSVASFLNSTEYGHKDVIDKYIPRKKDGELEQCIMYNITEGHSVEADGNSVINQSTIYCIEGWHFNTSVFTNTLTMAAQFVCDKRPGLQFAKTAFLLATILGSGLFGLIADKWGRRTAIFSGTLLQALAQIALYVMPGDITFFILQRFVVGVSYLSLWNSGIVLGTEMVGTKYRSIVGVSAEAMFGLGMLYGTLFSYLLRRVDWYYFHLSQVIPPLIYCLYYFWCPESPRWLAVTGQWEKAKRVLHRIARINRKVLPRDVEDKLRKSIENKRLETAGGKSSRVDQNDDDVGIKPSNDGFSYLQLLRNFQLMKRIMILNAVFIALAATWWGLVLGVAALPTDFFITNVISALTELVGTVIGFYMQSRLGRKFPMAVVLVFTGLACLGSAAIPDDVADGWLKTGVSMGGKLGISCGWAMVVVWAAELYPTNIRSQLIGFNYMMSRLGAGSVPLIMLVDSRLLPSCLYGAICVASGLLALLLPETRGKPMPDSMGDI